MRRGFTTGATAAAAAKAATLALLAGQAQSEATVDLTEAGVRHTFAIVRCEFAPDLATRVSCTCGAIKDGGDDPDVTHGAEIQATVALADEPGVHLEGGPGVGTVTRPGLGLEVGGPAINPVPRVQIRREVAAAAGDLLARRGLRVTISVPGGEALARHTLNPRLGILGGISILGTTGIVHPYSTAAYRASVLQGIDVAAANGIAHVVMSTGGRSESFARALYPRLPEAAFVEMGEFTGVALDRCRSAGIARATLAGMIGKFSKLAQGHFQTHVAGNRVDVGFLADVASRCGAPAAAVAEIGGANTARHVQEIALRYGVRELFPRLCQQVAQRSHDRARAAVAVEALLFDFDGTLLGRAARG